MDDLLTTAAMRLTNEVAEWGREYIENCIFFPQLGFLTVVSLDPVTLKGKYEGEGMEGGIWERMFVSNDVGYYKNDQMKELDAYFGDMYTLICGMCFVLRVVILDLLILMFQTRRLK